MPKLKKYLPLLCLTFIILLFIVFYENQPQISRPTALPTAFSTSTTPTPTLTSTSTPTPEPTYTATPTPEPTITSTPTPIFPFYYQVRAGDSLFTISQRFGVPIAFIVLENNLEDPDLIYVDQVLLIPDPSYTPTSIDAEGKQIIVVLSLQKVFVYQDSLLINEFVVSTGLPDTPTVEGAYNIYRKVESTTMTGPGYNLPDVLWVMYFYQGYSFHGTYWHSNFGQPMSHGCVNMKTEEAQWLYHWAPLGTAVLVLP